MKDTEAAPHRADAVVELLAASARLGAQQIVSDVSFAVDAGAVLVLTGPTGSGKSAVLRLVAGLIRPASGSVRVTGLDMAKRREARGARHDIGYLGAVPLGHDRITVIEDLRFCTRCHRIDRERRDAVVHGLIELFDLTAVADAEPATLTPGQRRRLALARVLVHDPAVLVLDEPLDGLDDDGRADVCDILGGLAATGKVVIVATNRPDELLGVASAIGWLDHGRLVDVRPFDDDEHDLHDDTTGDARAAVGAP